MEHKIPSDLKYTDDHEWAKIEAGEATIGITDFAQASLGDIVFVELPEVGTELEKGGTFGVVESIKSVSDLYSPLSGEVIAINEELEGSPENCNSDAYGAWIIKLKMSHPEQVQELMSAEDYEKHCSEQE